MAPGNKPQLVVSVNVQNPRKGGHFGAVVAGPVFYQVMKYALPRCRSRRTGPHLRRYG